MLSYVEELVARATKNKPVPPKFKHVRSIVLSTHEDKGSIPVLKEIFKRSLHKKRISCWKSLYIIHRVLLDGHPNTAADAYLYKKIFMSLINYYKHSLDEYGNLCFEYALYLVSRIEFHRNHPDISNNITMTNYQKAELKSRREDMFLITNHLLELQKTLLTFQNVLLSSKNMASCKLIVLVPIVIDSYNIYSLSIYLISRLSKSHPENDVFLYFQEVIKSQYTLLEKFYNSPSLRLVGSYVKIPMLDKLPLSLERSASMVHSLSRNASKQFADSGELQIPMEPNWTSEKECPSSHEPTKTHFLSTGTDPNAGQAPPGQNGSATFNPFSPLTNVEPECFRSPGMPGRPSRVHEPNSDLRPTFQNDGMFSDLNWVSASDDYNHTAFVKFPNSVETTSVRFQESKPSLPLYNSGLAEPDSTNAQLHSKDSGVIGGQHAGYGRDSQQMIDAHIQPSGEDISIVYSKALQFLLDQIDFVLNKSDTVSQTKEDSKFCFLEHLSQLKRSYMDLRRAIFSGENVFFASLQVCMMLERTILQIGLAKFHELSASKYQFSILLKDFLQQVSCFCSRTPNATELSMVMNKDADILKWIEYYEGWAGTLLNSPPLPKPALEETDLEKEVQEEMKQFVNEMKTLSNELTIQAQISEKNETSKTDSALANLTLNLNNAYSNDYVSHIARVTSAVQSLLEAAMAAQKRLIQLGRVPDSPVPKYNDDPLWSEGFISAAQAVVQVTKLLIECYRNECCIKEDSKLIATLKMINTATGRLVMAVRTKFSDPTSRYQVEINRTSNEVFSTIAVLLQNLRNQSAESSPRRIKSYKQLTELIKAEIEQQAEIISLERKLESARKSLHSINRQKYIDRDHSVHPSSDPCLSAYDGDDVGDHIPA